MPEDELIKNLQELDRTKDLKRQRAIAEEIVNKTSDPDLIREMEEFLRIHNIFKLS